MRQEDCQNLLTVRCHIFYEYGIFIIVFQGSQVPSWFNHQVESFSLSFDVPPLLHPEACGLNLCVVYSLKRSSVVEVATMSADTSIETKGLIFSGRCSATNCLWNNDGNNDMIWFNYWKSVDELESGYKVTVLVSSFESGPSNIEEKKKGVASTSCMERIRRFQIKQ